MTGNTNRITYRFVVPEDAEELLAIYRQFIDTSITFEYTLPSLEEFRERIVHITEFYPYIAAVCDGRIVGYAYSHKAFERAAYQWNAEFSVYIDREYSRRGIGRELYRKLIDISVLQEIHIVLAKVTSPNEPSESLHTAMGFRKLAVFDNVGYKNGEWHAVTWFELQLCGFEEDPVPPRSVHELPPKKLNEILQ